MAEGDDILDIAAALDSAEWLPFQKLLLMMAASAIIFDGLDNQLLGYALPVLSAEWAAPRQAFATILASGVAASICGSVACGWLADRFGRRRVLIGAVLLFGTATALTALVHGTNGLLIGRIASGFGIGGAVPCATALIAEFTPTKHRGKAVVLGMVCIPVGGFVGGILAHQLLPHAGWRALFAVGGIAPCAIAVLLLLFMPESPRFLSLSPHHRVQLIHTLQRIGVQVAAHTRFVDGSAGNTVQRGAVGALFASEFRADTILLCIGFFFGLFGGYLVVYWLPTLLVANGYDLTIAGQGLLCFNLGGIIGTIIFGFLLARLGTRRAFGMMTVGGALLVGLLCLPVVQSHPGLLLSLLALSGGLLLALQVILFPLAAQAYPVEIRSSGIGLAVGVGRCGVLLSTLVGPGLLALGADIYFAVLGGTSVVAGLAAMAVRRQIRRVAE